MIRRNVGLSSLKIGQKIGLGSTLALGITTFATIVSFEVGRYYEQPAKQQEKHKRTEIDLLQRLQVNVLLTQTSQQRLVLLAPAPETFEQEYTHFLKQKTGMQQIWADLKAFVAASQQSEQGSEAQILIFLKNYDQLLQRYSQEVERLERIRNLKPTLPNEVENAHKLLSEFTQSDIARQLDNITADLNELMDAASKEYSEAEESQKKTSEVIEAIVLGSIGLSVAIASLLAVLISRAIAQPIEVLTSVAQRATKEFNFDLRASVEQNDEIGLLASAFNQLIDSVKQLLQQQQIANESLETAFKELQRTQDKLIQQEKMAALGQLIAGVAHEINNPLGAIQASASNTHTALQEALIELPSLNQRLNSGEQEIFFKLIAQALDSKPLLASQENRALKRKITAQFQAYGIENARYMADQLMDMGICEEFECLLPVLKGVQGEWVIELAHNLTCSFANNQIILRAVERSAKIVFALKNYARFDQSGQQQLVQVADGLETVLEIYQNQLKYDIHLIRDYQDIPIIWGYPDELIQVWTNLIHNAIQAMALGGTLTIATYVQQNGIEVRITDTGSGIATDVQQKIFDAFFTTKAAGEGSGLGLYICQKIIDKHQGRMEVESQPGCSQFRVWLPIESV